VSTATGPFSSRTTGASSIDFTPVLRRSHQSNDNAREFFETNFYGIIRASQAFAPVLSANGGGAIVNVLSDVTWFAPPILTAYSATKSAAWSFSRPL
jgi:NAD(P)-dependent dehydrogenase (short-subunit alcohol dehydrogenase family)